MTEKKSMEIKHRRGGVRPGAGRPKGVPNKATADVKAQASQYSSDALNTLVGIMRHGKSEQARIAASKEVLDRAYGRPRQELDVTQNEGLRVFVYGKPSPVRDVQPALLDHSTDEAENVEES